MFLTLTPCSLLTAWEKPRECGEPREVTWGCWMLLFPPQPPLTSSWSALSQAVAQTLSQAVLATGSVPCFRARLVLHGCCCCPHHQEIRLRWGGSWVISSSSFHSQLKLRYRARAFSMLTLNWTVQLLAIFNQAGPSKKKPSTKPTNKRDLFQIYFL